MKTDMKDKRLPRVFWFLAGSRDHATSRIQGYQIHEYLVSQDWSSCLGLIPYTTIRDFPLSVGVFSKLNVFQAGDVAIFVKFLGEHAIQVMQWLKAQGVIVVFLNSDLPLYLDVARSADWVVCTSDYLASQYKAVGVVQVQVIDDAIEQAKAPKPHHTALPLTAIWFGILSDERLRSLETLRATFSQYLAPNWELRILSNHPIADIQWELETALDHIHQADVCVLTAIPEQRALAKSANRVTQAMALGLPVLAPPIPSYEKVIQQGKNGFIYHDMVELVAVLEQLTDADYRYEIAQNAYQYAVQNFAVSVIGQQWMTFLLSLNPDFSAVSADDKVGCCVLRARFHLCLSINRYHDTSIASRLYYVKTGLRGGSYREVFSRLAFAGSHLLAKFRHKIELNV